MWWKFYCNTFRGNAQTHHTLCDIVGSIKEWTNLLFNKFNILATILCGGQQRVNIIKHNKHNVSISQINILLVCESPEFELMNYISILQNI